MILASAAIYAGVISFFGAALMLVDKRRAVRKKTAHRISERKLLITAAVGAALAMWLTAQLIRHKTVKPLFRWGLPLLSIIHAVAVITVYFNG